MALRGVAPRGEGRGPLNGRGQSGGGPNGHGQSMGAASSRGMVPPKRAWPTH
jgi:hypothetical protein